MVAALDLQQYSQFALSPASQAETHAPGWQRYSAADVCQESRHALASTFAKLTSAAKLPGATHALNCSVSLTALGFRAYRQA